MDGRMDDIRCHIDAEGHRITCSHVRRKIGYASQTVQDGMPQIGSDVTHSVSSNYLKYLQGQSPIIESLCKFDFRIVVQEITGFQLPESVARSLCDS